ncbi:MAG TPA: hypothetical protein VJB16_02825, partial [archaeon]|nr:hypothetical protein [archaeon]
GSNWTSGNQTNGTGNATGNGSTGNGTGGGSGNASLTGINWYRPSVNTTLRGQAVYFTAFWSTNHTANRTLRSGGFVVSWNASGAFRNSSWYSFGTNSTGAWANISSANALNASLPNASTLVVWVIYANNSANEWNGTVNGLATT